MKVMLESTNEITLINGVACRRWNGMTEDGVVCIALIAAIAFEDDGSEAAKRDLIPIEEFSFDFPDQTG